MRTTAFPATVTDEISPSPAFERFTRFDATHCAPEVCRYAPAEVAALTTDRVMAMSRRELIEVLRSIRGRHLLPEVLERLPQMDAETLQRLVFLTRRFCRNQQRLTEDVASGVAVACA